MDTKLGITGLANNLIIALTTLASFTTKIRKVISIGIDKSSLFLSLILIYIALIKWL